MKNPQVDRNGAFVFCKQSLKELPDGFFKKAPEGVKIQIPNKTTILNTWTVGQIKDSLRRNANNRVTAG